MVARLERTNLFRHPHPRELSVVTRSNLVFGCSCREKLCHFIYKSKTDWNVHQRLFEQDATSWTWKIRRAMVDHVFLSALDDGSKPDALVVAAQKF